MPDQLFQHNNMQHICKGWLCISNYSPCWPPFDISYLLQAERSQEFKKKKALVSELVKRVSLFKFEYIKLIRSAMSILHLYSNINWSHTKSMGQDNQIAPAAFELFVNKNKWKLKAIWFNLVCGCEPTKSRSTKWRGRITKLVARHLWPARWFQNWC